jgi:hypothetical protein
MFIPSVIHTDALSVIYFRYTARPICISSNLGGSNKLSDDDRLLPKHVAASTQNTGVVQSVYIVGLF